VALKVSRRCSLRRRTRPGLLGLWFQAAEGAKFWLAVLTELKQRGVQDVLVNRGAPPPDPQDDQARGRFPTEEAARKLIYLSIINAQEELEDHLQPKRSPDLVQNPLRRPTALIHRE